MTSLRFVTDTPTLGRSELGRSELGRSELGRSELGRSEPRPEHPAVGTVRRRRVLYVEGYDPRGAEIYHQLFERSCERFGKVWPVSLTLKPIEIASDDLAHWSVEMRAANWQVATRYDFLRLERHIRTDMGGSLARQIWRALGWILDDLASGAQWRIFRASWRFGVHLLSVQLLFLTWL